MFPRFMLALCLLIIHPFTAADTVLLAADKWCPYNCEPRSQRPGFMIEIAQWVFNHHDIKVKYEVMPWSRAIDMARQGHIHGIVGATRMEVPEFVFPKHEQGMSGTAFFVKNQTAWRYKGMVSLNGIVLGVIQDYDYGKVMNRFISARQGKGVELITGDNATRFNIKKLHNGRVTTILEDPVILAYQTKQLNLHDQFINAGNLEAIDVYIAFSPKHERSAAYADLMTQGMKRLRESGQLNVILAKYGLKDWAN